jgi:lipid II:glycine glycyltransferase (peptidoglycan interpeptide bridge formation enzyme)
MPELTTCDDASAWDGFVSQASDASLLQAWAWGNLKSRHGWRVQRYFWVEAGHPIGAAAVLRRGLPGGLALNYAPRGPILDGRLEQWPAFWAALRERLAQDAGTVLKVDPE